VQGAKYYKDTGKEQANGPASTTGSSHRNMHTLESSRFKILQFLTLRKAANVSTKLLTVAIYS